MSNGEKDFPWLNPEGEVRVEQGYVVSVRMTHDGRALVQFQLPTPPYDTEYIYEFDPNAEAFVELRKFVDSAMRDSSRKCKVEQQCSVSFVRKPIGLSAFGYRIDLQSIKFQSIPRD